MSRRTQGLSRLLTRFRIRGLHPLRLHFPVHSPIAFSLLCRHPYNPGSRRFGLLRFRSPLLTESFLTFLSCRYSDVSLPCVSPCFRNAGPLLPAGSPIRTSTGLCLLTARRRVSPFAASFLRLSVPRHPPYALSFLA